MGNSISVLCFAHKLSVLETCLNMTLADKNAFLKVVDVKERVGDAK